MSVERSVLEPLPRTVYHRWALQFFFVEASLFSTRMCHWPFLHGVLVREQLQGRTSFSRMGALSAYMQAALFHSYTDNLCTR